MNRYGFVISTLSELINNFLNACDGFSPGTFISHVHQSCLESLVIFRSVKATPMYFDE